MHSASTLFGPCPVDRSLSSIVIWSLSTADQRLKQQTYLYSLMRLSLQKSHTHSTTQQHIKAAQSSCHPYTHLRNTTRIQKPNKMSELLENFSIEDLMNPTAPTAEQGSSTVSLSDLDMSLDLDMSDFPVDLSDIPTGGIDFSTPSVDFSVSTDSDFSFNSDSGPFNSDIGFNRFGSFDQFAQPPMMPQQFMPLYAPQIPYPSFGYQAPPGFMLVPAPAPVFYGQQPMMQLPVQMPMQNPSFSFTAPDAPIYPNLEESVFPSIDESSFPSFDEPEPMSAISASTPVNKSRRSRRTARRESSASPAPAKRQKASRSKTDKITYDLAAPISVLTAESNIPLKDMLAFANRSVAIRQAEANKAGKIPRPSNSFVMYRSAYADRVMKWASKNNHQNVSVITGSSWQIESETVRRFYMNCADIDKANHLKAFPGWKYNPKRPVPPESDDDKPTPRPNKKRYLTPHEDVEIFSPTPTPGKYNLRRRL
jgi:hypothetical protein